jgi:hypothetical protein
MRRIPGSLFAPLATLAIALCTSASVTPTAASASDLASQLVAVNLRASGGESAWNPENYFRLHWDRPAVADQGFPVTGAGYRIGDAAGNVLMEEHLSGDHNATGAIHIPWPSPGLYSADLWLEGPGGERGPQSSVALRYDNARPGPVQPLFPAIWTGRSQATVVKIAHPAGPLPLSGIRGYAVSVDRGEDSIPCEGEERCTVAETDLDGGIDDDEISIGVLPAGVRFVRAVAVSGSGMRSEQVKATLVKVDAIRPDTSLAGAPPGWADGPVRLTATATDSMSGMVANGPGGPFTAIAIDGGVPRTDPGASTTAMVAGQGIHTVAYYARDAAGNFGGDEPRTAAIRIDEDPPAVAFAKAQDPAEPERIEATVSDPLSGPGAVRGSIAVRPAGSHQPLAPLPTVVSPGRLVAHWDSDSSPSGTYEFRATGYDAAGNTTNSERRAGGARMVLTNPLKKPTEIVAGFGGRRLVWQRCSRRKGQRRCRHEEIEGFERRPTTRVTPYGHSLSYSGRLTSGPGAPLSGLPVQIVETFAAGADSPQRTTTVETAADGTFVTRLEPGPSRHVVAAFPGSRTLSRVSGGRVRLRVLGDVRMRASSATARIGGAPVVFSGGVGDLGAPIPAGGKLIELQFRFPGSEWSEFRTIRTDAHGHFRYRYSFSDDDSRGIRFQFRAFVPAQDGWAYEAAASRPLFVTGR